MNLILNTDSYKTSHYVQYPPGTKQITSYIEARKINIPGVEKVVFFGLQAFLKKVLSTPITKEDIDEAEDVFSAHGVPFNREGWEYILETHAGNLPLYIEAVDEGTVLDAGNVLVQVCNTDPKCFWLTSYIETALLRAVWYPTTVCSLSYAVKQKLLAYAEKCGTAPEAVLFKLHDFGARGVSSEESAAIGGLAHLVNFLGTDTVSALSLARSCYDEPMAGFSIPAAEHSTITSWGPKREVDAYRNMVDQFKTNALYAVVSDSYDLDNAVEHIWGEELKDEVIAKGNTLVVRPDSGDPTVVPIQTILKLMEKFGFTVNDKGYKVLPDCIRVIQGDGINIESIQIILDNLEKEKISLDNIAFGMGGGLLQQVNRDSLSFAMKCCLILDEDFVPTPVKKDPKTDPGKASKAGKQFLVRREGRLVTTNSPGKELNYLICRFETGDLLNTTTLSEVRERAK